MDSRGNRTLLLLGGGLALLLAVMVAVGWSVTHQLAHDWPFTVEDGFDRGLVRDRTPALDRATAVVSTVSGTPFAIGLTAMAAIGARLVFHRWREAWFVAGAVAVESGVFLATTLVVARPRPAVARLDPAPPTSSFPSGHTAAALALYGGVILLARRRGAGRPVWALLAVPLGVGMSRLYRGMHHPSDVAAGLLLGAMALALAYRVVLLSGRSRVPGRAGADRSRIRARRYPSAHRPGSDVYPADRG